MKSESLQELLAWNPPPVKQYIGSHILIDQGRLLIFAPPKVGKSVLAQQLCFCIATGRDWLGYPTQPGRVLYLSLEGSKIMFRDRLYKVSQQFQGVPPNALRFISGVDFKLTRNADVADLHNIIARDQPNIVVLDPWYKMMSDGDVKTYEQTMDKMDQIISKFGVALVVVHHDTVPQHSTSGKVIKQFHPRGPRTVEGWFDSIIGIEGDPFHDERVFRFELRHSTTLQPDLKGRLDRNRLMMVTT